MVPWPVENAAVHILDALTPAHAFLPIWVCGCHRSVCPCWGPPHTVAAKESVGVAYLEEKTLAIGVFYIDGRFASLRRDSSSTWLQPRYYEGCGFSPSVSVQLQHWGVELSFFSQDNSCRGGLPRTTYSEGVVSNWPRCPNFWQLKHCVNPPWVL